MCRTCRRLAARSPEAVNYDRGHFSNRFKGGGQSADVRRCGESWSADEVRVGVLHRYTSATGYQTRGAGRTQWSAMSIEQSLEVKMIF